MSRSAIKTNGVHYTPPELAAFLARAAARQLGAGRGPLRVLDPACGDGELLLAFARAVPAGSRRRLVLEGCETDVVAVRHARRRLAAAGVRAARVRCRDFLSDGRGDAAERYDVVIANPPYVRTQVLGSRRARQLAERFGLSGRVDLAHAFARAAAAVLKPGGALGLLTSNRFLTTQAGAALRQLLRTEFDLRAVYDLGDTRLFAAAVLPAIVVGRKDAAGTGSACAFDRVHSFRSSDDRPVSTQRQHSALGALQDRRVHGVVRTPGGTFLIQRGTLAVAGTAWTLSSVGGEAWMQTVRAQQACCFGDLGKVRVGIKTTADAVFIRGDWDALPPELRPEDALLRPLLTHAEAGRWHPNATARPQRILYPHAIVNGKRLAVALADYPRAAAYLESHRARLERRQYVREAGRRWYEIWVPHDPAGWARPKLVFPDIAEQPRFCLDDSGALVHGDCYWLALKPGVDPAWLPLMLAVANSTFVTQYYDTVFHNKLYAGRRRFMTQYVRHFPLPDRTAALGREIVRRTNGLLRLGKADARAESQLDALVWEAFGGRQS